MRLIATAIVAALLSFGGAQAADVPTNWVEVAAGNMFTMKAPPGHHVERIRTGTDAFASTIHGRVSTSPWSSVTTARLKNPQALQSIGQKLILTTSRARSYPRPWRCGASPLVGLHVPSVENDLRAVEPGHQRAVAKPEEEATVKHIYSRSRSDIRTRVPSRLRRHSWPGEEAFLSPGRNWSGLTVWRTVPGAKPWKWRSIGAAVAAKSQGIGSTSK